MNKSKKKRVLFSISTFLSVVSVIILWYSPIIPVIHEAGHGYMYELVTGNKCDYSLHKTENATMFETNCLDTGLTNFQRKLFLYSGFGFSFLVALLIMLTPFSIFGGTMLLINAYKIVAIEQIDFIGTPKAIVYLLAIILVLVGLTSIHLQVKWLDYFMKKIKKFK